ncbi:hypothetical protein [Rhodohalobacter sp. 614A]|uniref:hypothetical protein n=1 Tax=Rhodohalobacter sp. 614A TaxID=2908649 RepID=UPI001F1AEEF3|nr:hypothetical protein [Rhodohalobacter sp. 614A]
MSKLPLNQKTTVIAQRFIIAVANRINENEVIITYINLENHEEVLRIREDIGRGSQVLDYLDPRYWKIYADGNYITDFDLSIFQDMEVKIKVTTYDKSLEIVGFENKANIQKKKQNGKEREKGIVNDVK